MQTDDVVIGIRIMIILIGVAALSFYAGWQTAEAEACTSGKPAITTLGNSGYYVEQNPVFDFGKTRLFLHMQDFGGHGVITASSNKPVFGEDETAEIMGIDNVSEVRPWRSWDGQPAARQIVVKWRQSPDSLVSGLIEITKSWRRFKRTEY